MTTQYEQYYTHTPEGEFTCNFCEKTLPTKEAIETHIRRVCLPKQDEEKPFSCNDCELRFAKKNGLTRHMSETHGITPVYKQSTPRKKADTLALVVKATEVLFPKGVPSSRIMEVAAWQEVTQEMMTR